MKHLLRHLTTASGLASVALLSTLSLVAGSCGSSRGFGAGSGNTAVGSSSLVLVDMQWGRLVDVFDLAGVLIEQDVLIRENVQTDGITYNLASNAITQRETLTILLNQGTPGFDQALTDAQAGLSTLQAKGFGDRSPFTKVARNGAVQLIFSEPVDPLTVNRSTVQVLVGDENSGFTSLETRYVIKQGLGANGQPNGIIIIDPTVSRFDSESLDIPENGIGFPPSLDQQFPNVKLRIPTVVNPFINQTQLLTNAAGTQTFGPQRDGNGAIIEPFELSGLDPVVVRAFRSGNDLDVFNGFLIDNKKPTLLTEQDITISSVVAAGDQRRITYSIDAVGCRGIQPKANDVIETGGALVQVTGVIDNTDPNAYVVLGVLADGTLNAGTNLTGSLTTSYSAVDADVQLCYLTFTPVPETLPATGVDPFATISVRFSEPVDASTVRSLDSMVLASANPAAVSGDVDFEWDTIAGETVPEYIDRLPGFGTGGVGGRILFGPISASGDSQTFTLAPLVGITDSFGEGGAQELTLSLRNGITGILDLAGNALEFTGFVAGHSSQTIDFTLAGTPPSEAYFALRGNGTDENNDQEAEYGGQLGPNQGDGILRGRDVLHFSRQADQTNTFVGQRLKFTQGLMTPLTPAGAVLHTVYGYHHLGFGLSNLNEYNLDVEGLNWSPFDGVVFDDTFDRYSIALAHSSRYPDDFIDPGSGYPSYPNSGLKRLSSNKFDENIYGFGQDPVTYADLDEVVVFDTDYSISDINKFQTPGRVFMYPWPDFNTTYTWRDTTFPKPNGGSLQGGNANDGWGVPPRVVADQAPVYSRGFYPSIALPLLMRFRCYPRGQEFGFNGFQVQIMVGSSNTPAFRVFSSGGRDGQGIWHLVVPDQPSEGTNPSGGYNTQTGATTKVFGPELYWGQVDFVTKVSRVYTHWFDFGGTLSTMSALTLEPTPSQANPGTSVTVEFRASANVDVAACDPDPDPLTNASFNFDAYGDYDGSACGTVSTPSDWYADPADLVADGRRFFQLRMTFISNPDLGLPAEMDAFGFAYTTN
ncbi:MAG: Ig-like domain-containing domain [Planctomycetota bacterium]|jgi:hypothetical protein